MEKKCAQISQKNMATLKDRQVTCKFFFILFLLKGRVAFAAVSVELHFSRKGAISVRFLFSGK